MSQLRLVAMIWLVVSAAEVAMARPYGATFHEQSQPVALALGRPLTVYARQALEAAVRGEVAPEPPPELASAPAPFGLFVTAVRGGKVRGCFGRMEPVGESVGHLAQEAAHGAALLDVRNRPIAPAELSELEIIVSLVGPTEPIESISEVDPMSMGLLVRADQRTAVLLPGEARTARWQLAESRRKAGIGPKEAVQLFRFPTLTLIESALGLRPAAHIPSGDSQGEAQ